MRGATVGSGPEGIGFSPDGAFLAVATQEGSTKAPDSPFRTEAGKLVVFSVAGTELKQVAEAPTGHWSQGVVFSADGRTILVQLMGDAALAVFHFDGSSLAAAAPLPTGIGPIELSRVVETTDVALDDLPVYLRGKVTAAIHADSLDDARHQVQLLTDQAAPAPSPVPTFSAAPIPTISLGPAPTLSAAPSTAVPSTAPPSGGGG